MQNITDEELIGDFKEQLIKYGVEPEEILKKCTELLKAILENKTNYAKLNKYGQDFIGSKE